MIVNCKYIHHHSVYGSLDSEMIVPGNQLYGMYVVVPNFVFRIYAVKFEWDHNSEFVVCSKHPFFVLVAKYSTIE